MIIRPKRLSEDAARDFYGFPHTAGSSAVCPSGCGRPGSTRWESRTGWQSRTWPVPSSSAWSIACEGNARDNHERESDLSWRREGGNVKQITSSFNLATRWWMKRPDISWCILCSVLLFCRTIIVLFPRLENLCCSCLRHLPTAILPFADMLIGHVIADQERRPGSHVIRPHRQFQIDICLFAFAIRARALHGNYYVPYCNVIFA